MINGMAENSFDSLINSLKAAGHRITVPRRWTLRVLCEEGGHLTSEVVFKQLLKYGIEVDEATVYRTLQWLADNRIVTRTNLGLGADVYSLYEQPHHHLICLGCKDIQEIDDSIFSALRDFISREYGFTPQMDHYAIFGLCEQCRAEKSLREAD